MGNSEKIEPLFLLSDEPIASFEDDDLDMGMFRDIITGTVLGTVGPFTIGVYGRWGEGKTSLLRAAESRLRAIVTEASQSTALKPGRPEFPYVVPVWFNPWQYEAEEHPLVPLVAEIERAVATALIDEKKITKIYGPDTVKILKGIGLAGLSLLRSASAKAKVNAGVPGVVGGEFEVGISGKDFVEGLEKAWDRAQKKQKTQWQTLVDQSTYLTIFDRLKTIYAGLHATRPGEEKRIPRIAVFIDDLDRCQADKAFELIEAIKLVLGQCGFIFILALDKGIVDAYVEGLWRERLKARYGQEAARYLDKIVQLPLYLRNHDKSFDPFVEGLLTKMRAGGISEDTLAVFREVSKHLGEATEFGPRALVRRINTLLVDQKLRPNLRETDPPQVKALTPAGFLGLCLVQRTLLDYIERAAVLRMARDDAFCNQMAKLWRESGDRSDSAVADPISTMDAFLDKEREKRGSGRIVGNLAEGLAREANPDSPQHAAWREFLVKLDPYTACEYVLGTDYGLQWLESRVLRDLVTDFVSQRPTEAVAPRAPAPGPNLPGVFHLDRFIADTSELREQIAIIERAVRKSLGLKGDASLAAVELADVITIDLSNGQLNDTGAVVLASNKAGLTALSKLDLYNSKVTDLGVKALASRETCLTALTLLDLGFTQVTDSCLETLASNETGLRSLAYLYLNGTQITDKGVTALASKETGLKSLTGLYLNRTQVTDAGLSALASKATGLKSLTTLAVSGAQITDEGAKALASPDMGLTALTTLYLTATQITEAGAASISRAHPNLKIIR